MSVDVRAIIVGAGGQDGRLLRRCLHSVGAEFVCIYRDSIQYPNGIDLPFNVVNETDVKELVAEYKPDQIYYLAAHQNSAQGDASESQSYHRYSPFHDTHVVGLQNFLEGMRLASPKARLFYASSSLIFDGSSGPIQSEETPYSPVGFYGLTKLQGMMLCRHYRREHALFASCGILYSHESIHRAGSYLSKKIISGVHAISLGSGQKVRVGDFEAINDWGYAEDYVNAFQRILSHECSGDYVVATGEGHTVREFAQLVCDQFGLRLGDCVYQDAELSLRKTGTRIGNYMKLHKDVGWSPSRPFNKMVETLVSDYVKESILT